MTTTRSNILFIIHFSQKGSSCNKVLSNFQNQEYSERNFKTTKYAAKNWLNKRPSVTNRQKLVVQLYFLLLAIVSFLWILSTFLGMTAQQSISSVAEDAFKTIIGAIVGSLTVVLGGNDR